MGSHWIDVEGTRLVLTPPGETIVIEPWGRDAVRVRSTPGELVEDDERIQALLPRAETDESKISIENEGASLVNGTMYVEIVNRSKQDAWAFPRPVLRFSRADGTLLCEERLPHWDSAARTYRTRDDGLFHATIGFEAQEKERFYGLGQLHNGCLDLAGQMVTLLHRNSEVPIPFTVSSRGYGFLWNTPSIGSVHFAANVTSWEALATPEIDYWICDGGSPDRILDRYTEVVGRPAAAPDWFTGLWQSTLRYRSQEEVLDIARGHRDRDLPLSVIVIDFLHWTCMGDYRFDPEAFPDPRGMVKELEEMDVRVAVSIWPTIHSRSANWDQFKDNGWLIKHDVEQGIKTFVDVPDFAPTVVEFYDSTNPEARASLWDLVREGYVEHGISVLWLDCCEPAIYPETHQHLSLAGGCAEAVTNAYPKLHSEGMAVGLRSCGIDPVLLARSSWAGGAKDGVLVWSGDVPSTFQALRAEIPAGINMGLSGFPWWTGDIGGHVGGDPEDPAFRELLVRWFEYAVFLPVLRMHGFREPADYETGGAPNEIWSYGEEVEQILSGLLALREELRPEIDTLLSEATVAGSAVIRPLFWSFPDDDRSWTVADQFMLGDEILVAPVLEAGAREREVWLPGGSHWEHQPAGRGTYRGGESVVVESSLGDPPWFRRLRDGLNSPAT